MHYEYVICISRGYAPALLYGMMPYVSAISTPWTHLKSQYYSDTPYSFVHQMHSLFTIGLSFDSTQPVSDFIERYESK